MVAVDSRSHRFQLKQSWVVKVPPARVAEVLDIAVSAGATESGDIEWNVNDEKALEDRALEQASSRARSDAEVLAKGMGVKLGSLVYVTNQITVSRDIEAYNGRNFDRVSEPRAISQLLCPVAAVAKEGICVFGGYGGDGLRQGRLQLLDDPGFDAAQ